VAIPAVIFLGLAKGGRETSLSDLALSNPARAGANLAQGFPGAWLYEFL